MTALKSASPGMGDEFRDALDGGLTLISQHPFLARIHQGGIRRFVLRRFKLGVFYAVEGERVLVCRILDLRQSPEIISPFLEPFG
jgi:hypothetical protein